MPRYPVAMRGYDRKQVDALLDRIANGHDSAITADEVRASRFDVVMRGYDRRAVDVALHEAIRRLEAAARAGRPRPKPSARPSWLIGWVQSSQFTGTRLRPGYDVRDVDTFLARVAAGLRGTAPPVSARDVRESAFRTVRFSPGYDEREVDAFLRRLAAALDGH
ncbi:MAG: DivIVA domain-containing protein [Actinomadura sp.]